jgi:Ca-activated chloride channel family protein
VLTGRYHEPGIATVKDTAMAAGRRVAIPVQVALPTTNDFEPVASLWARREIENAVARGDVSAITRLGLEYHLVSEYTSFIAIDRSRVVSNGVVRTVEQPSIVPAGVDMQASGADSQSSYSSSSSSSSSSSYDDGGSFWGGGGGGGGPEDFEGWAIAFLTLGALWLIARRVFD